tara:strand:- start:2438 stop:3298 length:861 start_codon:yes stop_codon:yes gene_type:complete
MNEIVDFIQKESLKLFKKKFSKKYVKLKILPIIIHLENSESKKVLIGGSQGIGKSSLIIIIKKTLEKFFNKNVLALSLDNYYLSKDERKSISNKEHELLITRGVPGTHNIKKLVNDIKRFEKNIYPINIPLFDKLIDNRLNKYQKIYKKCNILILEGWCCGCKDINKNYLFKNINSLEKKFDTKYLWRKFYNNKLKNEYKLLFNLFDETIFLKAPSFKYVLRWRIKQEKNNSSNLSNSKKMSNQEIELFIQHYEKITKWMLKNYSKFANIVLKINKDQKITSILKI